jgi:glycosyltransferase involved in cell wall biosynthesis
MATAKEARRGMKILTCLTYYAPHISGLTVYARRLNKALVERGHTVTVLTSRYAHHLPRREVIDGVYVHRSRVWARFSKGVVMPFYPLWATVLARRHDLVHMHLPQWEASFVAALVRGVLRRPVVITYHCDITLPRFPLSHLFDAAIALSHRTAGALADRVVGYTEDYANHSPFLRSVRSKLSIVYPPVPAPSACQRPLGLREKHGLQDQRLVAFAARFAADKGIDYLLRAVPLVCRELPDTKFVLAGEYESVIGEKTYHLVQQLLEENREHVILLGTLPMESMHSFFSECDLLVVSSINSTESFGLVQVEAMLNGTPVVSTSLPGVRVPIQVTGMGELVPPSDERALAEGIVRVLCHKEEYVKPRAFIENLFSFEKTVDFYERLYEEEIARCSGKR